VWFESLAVLEKSAGYKYRKQTKGKMNACDAEWNAMSLFLSIRTSLASYSGVPRFKYQSSPKTKTIPLRFLAVFLSLIPKTMP
jgi:hypothetical protein